VHLLFRKLLNLFSFRSASYETGLGLFLQFFKYKISSTISVQKSGQILILRDLRYPARHISAPYGDSVVHSVFQKGDDVCLAFYDYNLFISLRFWACRESPELRYLFLSYFALYLIGDLLLGRLFLLDVLHQLFSPLHDIISLRAPVIPDTFDLDTGPGRPRSFDSFQRSSEKCSIGSVQRGR